MGSSVSVEGEDCEISYTNTYNFYVASTYILWIVIALIVIYELITGIYYKNKMKK